MNGLAWNEVSFLMEVEGAGFQVPAYPWKVAPEPFALVPLAR